ncbi:MAG: DUF4041 domain-containing protein [bacterium]|nr:DUF4041 domain-containing protein [bacterium]
MIIAVIIFVVAIAGILTFLLIKKGQSLKQVETDLDNFKNKYKDIIDIDGVVAEKTNELKNINQNINNQTADFSRQKEQLNQDFQNKRNIYENLLNEISILEENLEDISYGLYKPHFDYKTSEEFKQSLEQIREKQKQIIKDEQATHCPVEWTVENSRVKGKKMIKESSKLMLRAFNGECDAATSKVSWNNISNMEARIQKAYEALNKLGSTNQISITDNYLKLKLEELYLEFELEEKIYQEKEEQRKIREQMREEEKAIKEIEKARKDAEVEEENYQKALEKAKAEIEKAKGQEVDKLTEKIKQLEINLKKAQELKSRAISQAQLTKSGHIYIISNIGSFGDEVYKIGMTRRLEPMDRINELGDASVPFDFDVHGLIYSENAPEVENTLHKRLDNKRLNLVNMRAEFFKTSIDEIEQIVKEMNLTVQLTKLAEAREYRETISIREAKKQQIDGQIEHNKTPIEEKLEKFPTSLD